MDLHKRKMEHYEKAIELSQKGKDPLRELRLASKMALLNYKKAGFKKVRWVASYGSRTCKKCTSLNGKIYSIEKALKDMPLPLKDCKNFMNSPKYGFCRCCWVPVINIQ